MTDILPHLGFPAITYAHLAAECARELAARRRFYPGRVDKGNMTEPEATRELALAAAWAEDVARIRACRAEPPWPSPAAPPEHGLAWNLRRAGLLRELELRARIYPREVAGGKLLEAEAARRTACLECLLMLYEDGWDWTASDGRLPSQSPLAEREYAALRLEIDHRAGVTQQALAL